MLHILIVDDSREDAELLHQALREQRADISVTMVFDADAALAFLLEKRPVSLIVLDHYLPKKTAREFVDSLKQSHAATDCPVVVLTSYASHKHRAGLLEAGVLQVDDKPNDWEGYLAIAGRLIALCE